ncbi:MAG: NAD(P)/FAD-dependent oxidoreductase [Kangiellaceae bacterium]|nr:NAD(P)/FAD-dependent oxidoreductase [Kangiellaceae bacterium]
MVSSKRTKKPSTIRIGKRYRPTRIDDDYDAIVIGSGIGGLTTAASLSEMGQKVIVLEQHYTAGGFTHAYSREGYEWDVGVHYIGDVGYPTMSRKLFDFVSDGKLKWAAMDKVYDRIFLGDEHYDLVAGKKAYREEMVKRFPNEKIAIDQYLKLLKKSGNGMRWFTLSKMLKPWQQKLFSPLIKLVLPRNFNRHTYDVLRELTADEKLIAVLTGQWGDSGVPPKKSSFIIHCLIAKHYLNGGYYPVGGASRMAETIIPKIQATGGEVFTYAEVEQILIKDDVAIGVRMKDGSEILAPKIVSNAGVLNTYKRLLPDGIVSKFGYDSKIEKIEPSCANIGLFIGLKETAKSLGLPKTNFWIYLDENHDKNISDFFENENAALPVIYISFPSAKDPSFESRYPGRATIEIVAPSSYEMFEKWKGTTWGKRGDDYEALVEQLSEQMLAALYEKLPQLKGKIDYFEASTPLSTEFFCFYDRGEIYGLEHDPSRFEQKWLQPKSQIPNLWLTGQDVLSCGVAGAMIAGFLTAVQILGWKKGLKLTKQVMSNQPKPEEGWIVSTAAQPLD